MSRQLLGTKSGLFPHCFHFCFSWEKAAFFCRHSLPLLLGTGRKGANSAEAWLDRLLSSREFHGPTLLGSFKSACRFGRQNLALFEGWCLNQDQFVEWGHFRESRGLLSDKGCCGLIPPSKFYISSKIT